MLPSHLTETKSELVLAVGDVVVCMASGKSCFGKIPPTTSVKHGQDCWPCKAGCAVMRSSWDCPDGEIDGIFAVGNLLNCCTAGKEHRRATIRALAAWVEGV